MKPETFEMYVMTLHGFLLGLLAFLFGFCFILAGKTFWLTMVKWRWVFLGISVILFLVRFIEYDLKAPNYLMAVESNTWIFTTFGFAYRYLNYPGKAIRYLGQDVFPFIIFSLKE